MGLHFPPARAVRGTVRVPGDKSVTHRAYLLAAVADGVSRIRGANPGADCAATLAAVEALGAGVTRGGDTITIAGRAGALESPPGPLDLANSGTGMRLLAGLVAGRNVAVTLVGDASLSARPMGRIVEPLLALGARITATGPRATPPLVVLPVDGLVAATWRPPVASAQVKSAVLLAGLVARGVTRVIEPAPSRDHTERLLPAFGVACTRPDARTSEVHGPVVPQAAAIDVPGDFSAACFWLVAGSIAGAGELRLEGVGINPTRTGALAVLRRMGASIEVLAPRLVGEEPVADLRVRPATLAASDIEADEIPALIDELPALAIAQAVARGRSTLKRMDSLAPILFNW